MCLGCDSNRNPEPFLQKEPRTRTVFQRFRSSCIFSAPIPRTRTFLTERTKPPTEPFLFIWNRTKEPDLFSKVQIPSLLLRPKDRSEESLKKKSPNSIVLSSYDPRRFTLYSGNLCLNYLQLIFLNMKIESRKGRGVDQNIKHNTIYRNIWRFLSVILHTDPKEWAVFLDYICK